MNSSPTSSLPAETTTYVPGHANAKRIMLAAGLLVLLFGAFQLWTPLRLTLFGVHTHAEAVRVVKEKIGMPPVVATSDVQLQPLLETRDRSFTFWNEFEFQTVDGRTVTVRAGTGSQLKPLYTLTGWDGLPSTDRVCYDPSEPANAIFPFIISTWLAPAILFLSGLACSIIAAVLLYWANKPIEVPRIQAATAEEKK